MLIHIFRNITLCLSLLYHLKAKPVNAQEPRILQSRALVLGCDVYQRQIVREVLLIIETVTYLVSEATEESVTNQDVRRIYRSYFRNELRRDLRSRIHRLFKAIYFDSALFRRHIEVPNTFRQFQFRCNDEEGICGKYLTNFIDEKKDKAFRTTSPCSRNRVFH